MKSRRRLLLAAAALLPLAALAHEFPTKDPEDKVFEEVGVTEQPDAQLPLDLTFTDQDGRSVRLRDYFTGQPVVLTLNYYECPVLCSMLLSNLADTANRIGGLSLNRDFRIVTLSFNAKEKLAAAKRKADAVHGLLTGVSAPNERWPFLIGDAAGIAAVTRAAGYRFQELPDGEFAHPAADLVLTPEGKVSRYLYGMEVSPRDLRLALLEAAAGKIGGSNLVNQALLFCFHYDPVGKKYQLYAINLMKAVGVVTVLGIGLLFLALRRREKAAPPA